MGEDHLAQIASTMSFDIDTPSGWLLELKRK